MFVTRLFMLPGVSRLGAYADPEGIYVGPGGIPVREACAGPEGIYVDPRGYPLLGVLLRPGGIQFGGFTPEVLTQKPFI